MSDILLSVVIPTYNRYRYLRDCLKTTLSIESEQLEVIVQDNTVDNSEIVQYISGLSDNRVKYYHKAEHVSVIENSDLGVQHATGKYICMIGDDDTICARMLNAAAYCEKNGIEACCFEFPGFNWPDMTFEGKEKEANLFYHVEADGTVKQINAKEELTRSLKMGGKLSKTMPRIYHGMVSKDCLERIFLKLGTYFPGPSPDMANAVAVCLEARSTVYIRDYLMVSGYGYNSARGEGNRKQHYGKLDEKPWLPKDILQRWDKNLPAIFSGETIIAQSAVEALRKSGEYGYIKQFNYSNLYAEFLWHHKDAFGQILLFCLKRPWRFLQMAKGVWKRYKIRKSYKKNVGEKKNFLEVSGITSLKEAQDYTMSLCTCITEFKFCD